MKKLSLIVLLLFSLQSGIFAQENASPKKYVQITTIESVVGGGIGRSRMIVTKEDGSQEEKDMNNLFSMTGINMKNIKENETTILSTLKSYTDKGWKLESTIPLTLSPGQGGAGIFMTRYLLSKDDSAN